ncbi:puromycin-sensitive aminopeptidase-like, partial [Tropilaelaps mercedesae]
QPLPADPSEPEARQALRLPKTVVPSYYKLSLKIDLDKCDFTGVAEVDVTVNDSTTSILLNSVGLAIINGEFNCGKEKIPVKDIREKEDEKIEFLMEAPVQKGFGVLRYSFWGSLSDDLRGFYRCNGKNEKGQLMNFASTNFESADARRAFPCWDEPAIKAVFEVTLTIQKAYLALSNMPVADEQDAAEEGWRVIRFEPTPKMSTYLVCFVIGKFDYVEAMSARKIRMRVYTPIGKKQQGSYALQAAVKAIDFYEEYFSVPYPLKKADLIAIPDFSPGAMENWGLITFREASILYDPQQTSTVHRQWISLVVAHEIAHQWFGNLVTMEWWTYLWLNEGFAQFMESFSVSHFAPELDILSQFAANTLSRALELDALDNSHPIEVEVDSPAEVDEIFDAISYKKGACVIRMLYNYIGDEKFREGMSAYLREHAYGTTTSDDLWKALAQTSGLPIVDVMHSWVKQKGFPLVRVKSRKSGLDLILELKQEKFFTSAEKSKTGSPQLWKIPVFVGAEGLKDQIALLTEPKMEVEIVEGAKAAWIHINHGASGVFRVYYDPPMLQALIPAVRNRSISSMDRFILHSDQLALVEAGYASMKVLLELTDAYADELDYSVWTSISTMMSKLELLLGNDSAMLKKLYAFGKKLYTRIFKRLGWDLKDDDKPATAMLRSLVLGKMVRFGDEEVIKEAQKRFNLHVSGKTELAADLRMSVYRAVAQTADKNPDSWEQLIRIYQTAQLQEEANRVAIALGAVQTRDLLLK